MATWPHNIRAQHVPELTQVLAAGQVFHSKPSIEVTAAVRAVLPQGLASRMSEVRTKHFPPAIAAELARDILALAPEGSLDHVLALLDGPERSYTCSEIAGTSPADITAPSASTAARAYFEARRGPAATADAGVVLVEGHGAFEITIELRPHVTVEPITIESPMSSTGTATGG